MRAAEMTFDGRQNRGRQPGQEREYQHAAREEFQRGPQRCARRNNWNKRASQNQ